LCRWSGRLRTHPACLTRSAISKSTDTNCETPCSAIVTPNSRLIRALQEQEMEMDRIARELKCGKGLSQRVCQAYDREAAHAG
jgi:hypothetical protein